MHPGPKGGPSLTDHLDDLRFGLPRPPSLAHRLDRAAQEAVTRWRFVPARRGDVAVEAWVLVPIVFKLQGN